MLITVDKKAVDSADALKILQDTRDLSKPLGVTTMIYRPEDFKDKNGALKTGCSLRRRLRRITRDRLRKQMNRNLKESAVPLGWVFKGIINMSTAILSFVISREHKETWRDMSDRLQDNDFRAFSCAKGFNGAAANHIDDAEESHTLDKSAQTNVILNYPDHFDVYEYVDSTLALSREDAEKKQDEGKKTKAAYGFLPESISFNVLWHEIAHGIGADEAQADKISALMCRKYIADTRFLDFKADLRAVNRFAFALSEEADIYGWGTVRAFDDVIAMDQAAVDAMDENDLKAVVHEKTEQLQEDLKKVAGILHTFNMEHTGRVITTLPELFNACVTTAIIMDRDPSAFENIMPESSVREEIFNRLCKASYRLMVGEAVYQPGLKPMNAALLRELYKRTESRPDNNMP